MRLIRLTLLIIISTFFSKELTAQIIPDSTVWTFEAKKKTGDQYELIFHARILSPRWHIYSLTPGGDGLLISPAFKFPKLEGLKLIGKIKEQGNLISEDLDGDGNKENFFKNKVDYVQLAEIKGNMKITGQLSYQICTDMMCLPEKKRSFTFAIGDVTEVTNTDNTNVAQNVAPDTLMKTEPAKKEEATIQTAGVATETKQADNTPQPWWILFIKGFGNGLAAVITPCVFAMLPMTVSFFLKRSKSRRQGIFAAIQYSLSIMVIFTLIGAIFSLFGANMLNNIATNWIINIIFFLIFLIFGISFLGAFEITLPSSWATKTDSRASTQNFIGIFFMALTLVIVSFSCTVPFIGNLVVMMQNSGKFGPILGFLGFSVGLALPFSLFAIFPSLLQELGKQGGWLNVVKVTFGFVELALAMKFLSNADLARGWRLLDREIFIAIWFSLSLVLGLYLLGIIRFHHDSEMPKNDWGLTYLKIPRFLFAMAAIIFALYLLPGMWGAPLNGMSAFVPPMGTQDFVLSASNGGGGSHSEAQSDISPVKYVEEMKIYEPPVVKTSGLVTYFDYEEALAASKKLHKPVMLDFTGINCVNCRKMEAQVWSSPEVMKRLKNDFIIVSLYCDYDKHELPKVEQYFSKALQAQVITLGDKNEDLQATKYNSNSQPFYFYVDENGNQLIQGGYSYDPNVQKFITHLDNVKANYAKTHP